MPTVMTRWFAIATTLSHLQSPRQSINRESCPSDRQRRLHIRVLWPSRLRCVATDFPMASVSLDGPFDRFAALFLVVERASYQDIRDAPFRSMIWDTSS